MSITQTRVILDKETIPHVELNFMNNTHFEEIEMVKNLGILISDYQDGDTPSQNKTDNITQALQVWLDHTEAHFARENELMLETGFPAYAIHSEEHKIALNNMQTTVNAWNTNKDIELISDYVFAMWPAWFNGHVNSMDMMTAKFAIMNGYTEN